MTASGLILGGAAPAQAALASPAPQEEFIFESASGSDWIVPTGVSTIYVGLRGGNGGSTMPQIAAGAGDNMVVRVAVTAGDRITVYAGKNAQQRVAGAGYAAGGAGGGSSLDGKNGGGGGGAAALLINGTVAAVAGGGGGAGGTGGSGAGHGAGGVGGGVNSAGRTPGVNGGGAHPGAGAGLATASGRAGANGGTAPNISAGGGGGAGGGGWQGGKGGDGGRRAALFLAGNSGGGGGAAGTSAVTGLVSGVTRVTDAETVPKDMRTYRGPVAEAGTVKIVIPRPVEVQIMTSSTVSPQHWPSVAFRSTLTGGPKAGETVYGRVTLTLDGAGKGTYGDIDTVWSRGADGKYSYGPMYRTLPRLALGTHTYVATYDGGRKAQDYAYPEERATATAVVRSLADLTGTVSIGGAPAVGETLTVDASGITSPAPLGALSYQWQRNDRMIPGATGLSYTVTPDDIGGTLSVRVGAQNYWEKLTTPRVKVVQTPVLTLTTDPSGSLVRPDDLEVSATLAAPGLPADGNSVELLIDGVPVDSDATRGGLSTFTLTDLVPGSYTLTAAYGGGAGYAAVTSAPVVVTVGLAAQTMQLHGVGDTVEVEDEFRLSVSGASGTGAVEFEASDPAAVEIDAAGAVTVRSVGTFTITAVKRADATYAETTSARTFTVLPASGAPSPAPVDISGTTVGLSGGPFVYTGAPIQPGISSVTLGDGTVLEAGDYTVAYSANTTDAGVGSVTITGQRGYTGTAVQAFVIAPQPVTITADDEVMVHGEGMPSLDWDADPALAPGDAIAGALAAIGPRSLTEVGSYDITQGTLDLSNPNYAFTFVPGTFVVAPAREVAEFEALMHLIPNPVTTLDEADLVAQATILYAALTPQNAAQVAPALLSALEAAQQQAGSVNQNDLEDGVESASDELAANWNIRMLVTPRTWDGSPEAYARIAGALAPSNQLALALYDLSFVDTLTGQPWQPQSPVTIEFTQAPLAGWDTIGLVREASEGVLAQVPAIVKSGTVTFATSTFGLYAVTAQYETATAGPGGDGSDGGGEGPGAGPDGAGAGQALAATGAEAPPLSWTVLSVLALIVGAGLLWGGRRRAA